MNIYNILFFEKNKLMKKIIIWIITILWIIWNYSFWYYNFINNQTVNLENYNWWVRYWISVWYAINNNKWYIAICKFKWNNSNSTTEIIRSDWLSINIPYCFFIEDIYWNKISLIQYRDQQNTTSVVRVFDLNLNSITSISNISNTFILNNEFYWNIIWYYGNIERIFSLNHNYWIDAVWWWNINDGNWMKTTYNYIYKDNNGKYKIKRWI